MRVQLALNVEDLQESIDFYRKMFDTEPYKIKQGYANFEIEQPPLKLVLFEGAGPGGTLNHLGVEVESADQVEAAEARISGTGLDTTGVDETMCCYAGKTETWVHGPDTRWEWYVKNSDQEQPNFESVTVSTCCQPDVEVAGAAAPGSVESAEDVAASASTGCC
jgi:catechol 2,3-dioxygenase-like lactoylglutathione lyase family enzyme